jgi:hypothetical protein
MRLSVDGPHRLDGLGHLLAVGADVLDGRCASAAGNAAQPFQASEPARYCLGDHVVPRLACLRGEARVAAARVGAADAPRRHRQHEAVETGVGHDQVAATAQHPHLDGMLPGPCQRLKHIALGGGLDQVARPAAHTHRRTRAQRGKLHQLQAAPAYSFLPGRPSLVRNDAAQLGGGNVPETNPQSAGRREGGKREMGCPHAARQRAHPAAAARCQGKYFWFWSPKNKNASRFPADLPGFPPSCWFVLDPPIETQSRPGSFCK